ncbi:hypothetical protein Godav_015942 [Gossypium davidsonii]|uniref:Uncharacterized protein n=1 Tax=Gossypium davidsonii TaxID=34287 RepID=A0A7J8RR63_GOSDV|nr:hypothetical protein [Gossypium davidsonii]
MLILQFESWIGYAPTRSQCKRSLFLVSLLVLRTYFKMELQYRACVLFGNKINTLFHFTFPSLYVLTHINGFNPSIKLYAIMSTQLGSQVNVTCSTNGRTTTYFLPGASSSQIQSLCSQQCS